MKENKLDYTPEPMDLSSVDLPESLIQLSERIAENVHEVWAKARMDEGWTYGGKRDDIHKKHPCLVPYDELPEEEKEYHFTAQLYQTDPFTESMPLKGKAVTEPRELIFKKAEKVRTALKITGVRISDSEGWRKGQSFNVQVLNMPPEGQITVTAYEGLTGWQRSDAWNVSMEEGKISNACASKGTFRLIFEIKNAAGEVVCLAPYYLIVK